MRDIDDALCLIALFGTLPTSDRIPPSLIENCARLYNEWLLYVIHTHSLKKVFLSIKGVYYQAVVQGETVTWIVPWQFTQAVSTDNAENQLSNLHHQIPADVDVRVMLTFLELYQTLLGFVFFKIYTDEGWAYPPPLDISKDDQGAGIGALSVVEKGLAKQTTVPNTVSTVSGKDVRAAIKAISSSTDTAPTSAAAAPMDVDSAEQDEDFVPQPSKSDPNAPTTNLPTYQSLSTSTNVATSSTSKPLFHGLTFWLSRETPRALLEFVIRAFGGRVGWDERAGGMGSMFPPGMGEDWAEVTHVIIDRPVIAGAGPAPAEPNETVKGKGTRKYIQPQWVVDCINAGTVLSEDRYERGKVLPPHLSPFGEAKGAYQPLLDASTGNAIAGSAVQDTVMGDAENSSSDEEEEIIEGEELPDEEEDESAVEEDDEEEAQRKQKEAKRAAKALRRVAKGDMALRAAELEAEAAGVEYGDFEAAVKKAKKSKSTSMLVEEDNVAEMDTTTSGANVDSAEKDMNKMMMSNKQRKLYEKMKYSERKREAEVNHRFHLAS